MLSSACVACVVMVISSLSVPGCGALVLFCGLPALVLLAIFHILAKGAPSAPLGCSLALMRAPGTVSQFVGTVPALALPAPFQCPMLGAVRRGVSGLRWLGLFEAFSPPVPQTGTGDNE